MWRILKLAAADPAAPPVICVLDALDECRDSDRQKLIFFLCDLFQHAVRGRSATQLKFLVTSRPYDSVQRWFEQTTSQWPHIRLRGEDENEQIHQEINLVIDHRVKDLGAEFALSRDSQERLRRHLVQMQNRTYLWLYLVMDEVRETYQNSLCPDFVMIDSLPQSVEEAYERLLQRIHHKQQSNARQVLLTIVGARRPLKVEEMAWALTSAHAHQLKSTSLVAPNVQHLERQIRHWCGLFVFIQHSTLFLIHQTAKEFLLSNSLDICSNPSPSMWRGSLTMSQVELEMLRLCTTYLCLAFRATQGHKFDHISVSAMNEEAQEQVLHVPDCSAGFFEYCAEYWPAHLQDEVFATDSSLLNSVLALYDDRGDLFFFWFNHFRKVSVSRFQELWMPSQHIMAFNGHHTVLKHLHGRHNFDLNARDSTNRIALHWAVERGHLEVSRWLIERGTDVNAGGGDCGSVLHVASRHGHEEIVQILIEHGADMNAQGGRGYNALQEALRCGHGEVVRILLEHGADVNAEGRGHGNALCAAAAEGHEEIVQILIEHGADVNARGGDVNARGEDFNARRVDVDAQGEDGSAIQAASRHGHEKIVQILIEHGADVNAQGGRFGNALQTASVNGHEKIVQILLDKGADINAQGRRYGNALQAASWGGHEKIVQTLLDRGADVNAYGGRFGNALQAASARSHEKIVQILLDRGADVNTYGGYFGNALQAASRHDHEEIVQILIEHGADVNAQGGPYGSALQAASVNGHEKIVQILIKEGAKDA